jgi:hypothetical protein
VRSTIEALGGLDVVVSNAVGLDKDLSWSKHANNVRDIPKYPSSMTSMHSMMRTGIR